MPHTTEDDTKRRKKDRDALDVVNAFILFLTLVAAGSAAFFTGRQAAIARDQEHRALRAYVVVTGRLGTENNGQLAVVTLTYENMGQTPVYDLVFEGLNSVIVGHQELPIKELLAINCKDVSEDLFRVDGKTFSKVSSESRHFSTDLSGNPATLSDIFAVPSRRATVYGTVCYRDIFRQMHSIRICYRWYRSRDDSSPENCLESGQENEDY